MKQTVFFPEMSIAQETKIQENQKKYSQEKAFPKMNTEDLLKNALSDRFVDDNGMLVLRTLLKRANKAKNWKKYQNVLQTEMSFKKGKNTLKNHLRHLILTDLLS